MKVNIFEGARRISLLIGALWVVGWSADAIFSEPESGRLEKVTANMPQANYFDKYDAAATAKSKSEPNYFDKYDNAPQVAQQEQPKAAVNQPGFGARINADIKDIPRQLDPREELIALRRMAELEDKAAKAPRGTAVPEDDLPDNLKPEKIDALEAIQRKALLEQWGVAAMFLFGGLAAGWAVVAAIGWIVRGFMGIPRGQDMRPPT